jgi:hypothetical protein
MEDFINEFSKLSVKMNRGSIELINKQLNNMDLTYPNDNDIDQLIATFTELNLDTDVQIISKFLEFIKILRKKTPCGIYTNWTNSIKPIY